VTHAALAVQDFQRALDFYTASQQSRLA